MYIVDVNQSEHARRRTFPVIGACGQLEDLFKLIHERGSESAPDFITVDRRDDGTGAAPMSLMVNVGLPIRESLPLVVDLLNRYALKRRIRVRASGKMITPAEAAGALGVGADFINSARGFMFALGCIQALQRIPVPPASLRMTNTCNADWSWQTRRNVLRNTRSTCIRRLASLPLPVV